MAGPAGGRDQPPPRNVATLKIAGLGSFIQVPSATWFLLTYGGTLNDQAV